MNDKEMEMQIAVIWSVHAVLNVLKYHSVSHKYIELLHVGNDV